MNIIKIDRELNTDKNYICSCYRTVPSAIWEIFPDFLIFCNLFYEPLGDSLGEAQNMRNEENIWQYCTR